ncbi:MAG: transcription antitermination factor NusB [bacterium]
MTKQELRESRILAMQLLYHFDLVGHVEIDTVEVLEKAQSDFTRSIVTGVINDIKNIDEIIEKNLTNYTLNRLSYVDRALTRAATYEFLCKTPANIVINETLEIVKEYSDLGDGKNKRFIHSLIDKINKSL